MTGIPVIIPYFKAEARFGRVLAGLEKQTEVTHHWIRDNSVDNVYYTKAVNEGLLSFITSPAKYLLILCDDVFMHEGCLSAMIRTAEAHPQAGIISPIQIDEQGKITWSASLASWPGGIHVLDDLRGREAYDTHWASGACFLLRMRTLHECGVLDGNMRFICSDADYSLTVRSRGWRTMVAPSAVVTHGFNGCQDVVNMALNDVKVQDMLYFTEKWLSGGVFRVLEHQGDRIKHQDIRNKIRDYDEYLRRRREDSM